MILSRQNLELGCYSVRMGFKNAIASPMFVIGSFITYAVLIVLFSGIIRMFPPHIVASLGVTTNQLIWYMGTGELMVFMGASWAFKELYNEIQSGTIEASLIRPTSHAILRAGIWCGEALVRMVFMVPFYLVLLTMMTGEFGLSARDIFTLVLSIPASILIMACAGYLIGFSTLWVQYPDPVYWVWEKFVFLFGAMLWPLIIYPEWMQTISWLTPFPAMVAVGANTALHPEAGAILSGFAHQIFWVLVFVLIVKYCWSSIMRKIQTGESL